MVPNVPSWMNEASLEQFKKSALQNESPKDSYTRIAKGNNKLFEYLYNGWICPSTPVLANYNTDRGLPIACFSSSAADSLDGILDTGNEIARLTKAGGGTAVHLSGIRSKGDIIAGGGVSNGVIGWCKIYDTIIDKVRQGNVRRGAIAFYLDAYHKDVFDFLRVRRPEGDQRNQCLDSNIAITISDEFMERLIKGGAYERELWHLILKERLEMGEPYILFTDNANRDVNFPNFPQYKVSASNLCVSGSTPLLTKEFGYVPIKDVVGKLVNVWNGDEWSQVKPFKTADSAEMLEITLSNGMQLVTTEYHKFYTKNDYHAQEVEVEARSLRLGDKLIKTKFPTIVEGEDNHLDAYTAGFFSGDGTTWKGANFVDLYHDKRKLESLIDVSGYNSRSVNDSSSRIRVRIGQGYSKEYVPNETSLAYKLRWLAGLLDSDGCITDNKGCKSLQVASVNPQFLRNVLLMLNTIGVDAKVVHAKAEGDSLLPDGKGGVKLYPTKKVERLLVRHADIMHMLDHGLKTFRLDLTDVTERQREASHLVKVVAISKSSREPTYCVNEPKRHKVVFNSQLTGNCSEIMLHSDEEHTFVCCLSSLNLAKWNEWKDTDVVDVAVELLDDVIEEFLVKTANKTGFDRSRRFAEKSRALGLGVLGWHTLCQQQMISIESREAAKLNNAIFKQLRRQSYEASSRLAETRGVPEWCQGLGRRNSHLLAVAPTFSNSIVSGFVSEGVNPISSNAYLHRSSKRSFIRYNQELLKLNLLTEEDWKEVENTKGSVQLLNIPQEVKEVFKTAKEINQLSLISLAGTRQQYIDQGQSVNLYCHYDIPKNIFNLWHIEAWKQGLKSLYYVRSSAATKGDSVNYSTNCSACEA